MAPSIMARCRPPISGSAAPANAEIEEEIRRLERKVDKLRRDVYSKLTRWQRVKLARHPRRPYTLDYLKVIAPGFLELHGDRRFGDDPEQHKTMLFFGL